MGGYSIGKKNGEVKRIEAKYVADKNERGENEFTSRHPDEHILNEMRKQTWDLRRVFSLCSSMRP